MKKKEKKSTERTPDKYCPLCKGNMFKFGFNGAGHTFYRCSKCKGSFEIKRCEED